MSVRVMTGTMLRLSYSASSMDHTLPCTDEDALKRTQLYEAADRRAAFWGAAVIRASLYNRMAWIEDTKRRLELLVLCDDVLGLVASRTQVRVPAPLAGTCIPHRLCTCPAAHAFRTGCASGLGPARGYLQAPEAATSSKADRDAPLRHDGALHARPPKRRRLKWPSLGWAAPHSQLFR